jgi:phospholipid N-methyltransferase
MVGSGFPATGRMVRHVLAPLDWSRIGIAVEYGPGSGRFTFEMLRCLRSEARLVAIETGAAFVEKLRSMCDDPRLIVIEGSATDVRRHLDDHGLGMADCILSGLPFSTLEPQEAEAIMRETAGALAAAGLFAAYQMRTAIRPLIDRHFARVRHGHEWWNIPPCHLYWATGPSRVTDSLA